MKSVIMRMGRGLAPMYMYLHITPFTLLLGEKLQLNLKQFKEKRGNCLTLTFFYGHTGVCKYILNQCVCQSK